MQVRLAAALLAVAACKFPYPADVPDDDVELDATAGCEASTTICDDASGEYVACSATGTVDVAMHCPLGCAPAEEKCLDIDPYNGLATYLDMARGLPAAKDVVLDGASRIVGTTVFHGAESVDVPFVVANGVTVLMFRSLVIRGTLTIEAMEQHQPPLALVADGDISIEGVLDISARGRFSAPGACTACDGLGSSEFDELSPTPGGGGGGGYTRGGRGGQDSLGQLGWIGGSAGTSAEPLQGGGRGGWVYENGNSQNQNMAIGGGGGGAVQVVSRTKVTITGAGAIDASGGGGKCLAYDPQISASTPGAGGGGGGAILIEAPQVVLDGPQVVLSTKGGGGSAPGRCVAANDGAEGGTGPSPAPGGDSDYAQYPRGGNGGMTDRPPQAGESTTFSGADGAGGGGSAGWVYINTRSGFISPQGGATIISQTTIGRLRSRLVP